MFPPFSNGNGPVEQLFERGTVPTAVYLLVAAPILALVAVLLLFSYSL